MNTKEKVFNQDTVETIKGSWSEPREGQPSAADRIFTALAKPEAHGLMAVFMALMQFLLDPGTAEAFKMEGADFTRTRKILFTDIIMIILFGTKATLSDMLKHHWNSVKSEGCYAPVKSSFSEARRKINPAIFDRLIQVANDEYNLAAGPALFKGMAPMSIDATDVLLGKGELLKGHFGEHDRWAIARAVMAHNPLDGLFYALSIDRYEAAERDIFKGVWRKVKERVGQDVLFLMDAGYPSRDLIASLVEAGDHFVMRCSKSFLKPINEAPAGLSEADLGGGLKVQVLKVRDMWGKDYTLVTDLGTLSEWEILWLYRQRWVIEVFYDYLKHRIGAVRFTGRTPEAVTQDLYASVLLANLCTMAANMANNVTEREIIREAQAVLGGDFSPLPQRPDAKLPEVWSIGFDLSEEEVEEETIKVVLRKIGDDKKSSSETAETQATEEAKERPQTEKEAGEGNGKTTVTETAADDTNNGKAETPDAETAAGETEMDGKTEEPKSGKTKKKKRKKSKSKEINTDRVAADMALVPVGPAYGPKEKETVRPKPAGRRKLRIENKWTYKASQNAAAGCREEMEKIVHCLMNGETEDALDQCYRILHACTREKVAEGQRGSVEPRKAKRRKPRVFEFRKLNL